MERFRLVTFKIALVLGNCLNASVSLAGADIEVLKKMSLEDILNVEVVSKKAESQYSAAGIVSIVTRDDIERYGANTLADVLNRVTSVYMLSTYIWSNSTAAVRGDALTHVNNHTLVLINGRPFRDSAYGGLNETMFRDFPIHHIEQIEVVRGSGSVLYGSNAFTGVINIVTQKKQDNRLTVRGRYGSYNTGQAETEFGWNRGDAAISGAVRYRASDGWTASAVDETRQNVNFRNDDGDVSASIWGGWREFDFNLYVVNSQKQHWGAVPIGFGQQVENNRLFFDAGYNHQINDFWRSKWNLTLNKFSQNYNLPVAGVPYLTDLWENNLLLEQSHFLSFFDDKLNLLLGGLVEWQQGQVTQVSQPNTLAPYEQLKSSIYANVGYAILDNLQLNLGGQWHRFDHLKAAPSGVAENDNAIDGLVGRAGLVYEMTANWGAKLLFAQAYRAPSAGELGANSAVVLGNRSVEPEKVETADAQIFYHDADYQISLTAFESRVTNLIVRSPIPNTVPTRLLYVNGGCATFEGLELETEAKLLPGLSWKGSYTFQTNRDENQQNNKTLMPNHMAKLGLSYDFSPNLQIGMFDTYFSAAKAAPSALLVNPPAGGYHNVSVNANYKLNNWLGAAKHKHMTFTLYLDNVLDENFYYPEFNRKNINTVPASPGRMLFGEIALEF